MKHTIFRKMFFVGLGTTVIVLYGGDLEQGLLSGHADHGSRTPAPFELQCDDGALRNALRNMHDNQTKKDGILAETIETTLQHLQDDHARAREALQETQTEELQNVKRRICAGRCITGTGVSICMFASAAFMTLGPEFLNQCPK